MRREIGSSQRNGLAKGKGNPALLYSETRRLKIADQQGQWSVWAGQPDALFWKRSDVLSARRFAWIGYASTLLLTLGLITLTALSRRHRQAIEIKNMELEGRVQQRTAELQSANAQLQALATTDPLTGLPNHRSSCDGLGSRGRAFQSFRPPVRRSLFRSGPLQGCQRCVWTCGRGYRFAGTQRGGAWVSARHRYAGEVGRRGVHGDPARDAARQRA